MTGARTTRALTLGCLVLGGALVPAVSAAQPSAGQTILQQARAAWDKRSFNSAGSLYRDAIEKGGLAPDEVLEGYVRLGSSRALTGKKDQAILAFRAASVLDANFTVPPEAARKAGALAAKAKRDTAKIGSINVTIQAPKETPSGKGFRVTGTLDTAHLPVVAKVGLLARDGTTGKETSLDASPAVSVDFDVPADITLPSANILVRFDALDKNGNRLASAEDHVKVPDPPPVTPTVTPVASAPPASWGSSGSSPPGKDSGSDGKKGGFWSSPWPYIVGGAAIAGAGAGVYFVTRPTDNVSVGQVGVRTR